MRALNRAAELEALNAATKYPSILTYHVLQKGTVTGTLAVDEKHIIRPGLGEKVHITEKVDGENFRIVIYDENIMVGTRENLIWHYGDWVLEPRIKRFPDMELFERIKGRLGMFAKDKITVLYGEYYGDKIQKTKYTDEGRRGFRLFDIAEIDADILFAKDEAIASWRDGVSSGYWCWYWARKMYEAANELKIATVPYRGNCTVEELPTDPLQVKGWLEKCKISNAWLDADRKETDAEGVVIRTEDRSWIRKIRFDDYKKVGIGK